MDSLDWSNPGGTLSSSFEVTTPSRLHNPDNGLIRDSRITSQQTNPKISTNTSPVEALDCLLSSSNSQTDASSTEDDGISMIFSGCKRLWSFKSTAEHAVINQSEYPGSYHVPEYDATKERRTESPHIKASGKINQQNLDLLKKPGLDDGPITSSTLDFQQQSSSSIDEPDSEAIAHMKELIYRTAIFRPVNLGTEIVEKPKRKNVKISNDPQTAAARLRRERISERIRVLQRLVPGGSKMDTGSMLDEAANYLKFLRSQIKALEALGKNKANGPANGNLVFAPFINSYYSFGLQQSQFSIQPTNPKVEMCILKGENS